MRAGIRLALVAAVLSAGCGDSPDAQVIKGTGYHYDLPEGWSDEADSERVKEFDFVGFRADTFAAGDLDEGFRENVNVLREGNLAPGVDTEEYAEASERILRNPDLLPAEARANVEDLNPRDFSARRRLQVGGVDALSLDYTGTTGGKELRFRNVITVRRNVAYGITYTALRDHFDAGVDDFEHVLDTWAWD